MTEDEIVKKAQHRASEKIGFLSHFVSYIGVNLILLAINLVTSSEHLWFYWVTVFWGLGLLWHFIGIFVLGSWLEDWKEKIMHKEIEKIKNRNI